MDKINIVRVGSEFASAGGQTYNISKKILHHEFPRAEDWGQDIALVQIEGKFKFIPGQVEAIEMIGKTCEENLKVKMSGYGKTCFNCGQSEQLMETTVTVYLSKPYRGDCEIITQQHPELCCARDIHRRDTKININKFVQFFFRLPWRFWRSNHGRNNKRSKWCPSYRRQFIGD